KFTPGTHSGILLVRLRSPDRSSLIQRIKQVFLQEEVALWSGCFVGGPPSSLKSAFPHHSSCDVHDNLPVILPLLQQLIGLNPTLQRQYMADLWRELLLADPLR